MKKTTLYKLVKQALKEIFFEDKDKGKNKIRISPKTLKLLSEKITPEEYTEILNYTSYTKYKSPLLEQIDRNQIKKIYEFLTENAEEKVPFERIAKDPILKGLNSDGLQILYGNVLELSFEEFEEIIIELFMQAGCSNFVHPNGFVGQQSYGTQEIYDGCTPQTITDGFICCSNTNNTDNQATPNPTFVAINTSAVGPVTVLGNQGCMDPNDWDGNGGTITTNQFTFQQFEFYALGMGGLTALAGISSLNNAIFQINSANDSGCGGCAHDQSLNYNAAAIAGCEVGGTSPQGGNGQFSQQELGCCQFTGCGAIATTPAATNPGFGSTTTTTLTSTNGTGVVATADETMAYWTDNGQCNFEADCTNVNITIGQTSHATTNYAGSTTVTSPAGYDFGGSPNTPSPYNGASVTSANPSLCNITVCADEDLDPVNGPNAALLATQGSYVTNFVAAEGTYNTGLAQYTVTNNGTQDFCTLTACLDQSAANYLDASLFPLVDVVNDSGLCVANVTGCGPATTTGGIEWNNYNPSANVNDDSCWYEGCTDYSIGGSSGDYVCTLFPYMCDMTQNGGAGAPDTTLPEVQNALANTGNPPFTHDQSYCSGIIGCTDSGTNQDPTWWSGTNYVNFDYATATGVAYGALGQPTNYNLNATQENGLCSYNVDGCTGTIVGNDGVTYTIPAGNLQNQSTGGSNTVVVEDNSCEVEACWNQPTATNYFCTVYPGLCNGTTAIDTNLIQGIQDDGSCSNFNIPGCLQSTDPATACNPTPGANSDNGSCLYPGDDGQGGFLVPYASIDPTYTCDCLGNPQGGECDCYGNVLDPSGCGGGCGVVTPTDLCGDCNGTCQTYNTNCPDGQGGHYCNCSQQYEDCAGNCNGPAEEDDCGFCHSLGLANTTDPINTCHGCMIPEDTAGNYSATHTSDPNNECVFIGYCTTPLNTFNYPSNNYICASNPDLCYAQGGSPGDSAYGATGGTGGSGANPCTSNGVNNTCIPDSSLGNWGASSGCQYPVVGCMDSGGTQTWGLSPGNGVPFTYDTNPSFGGGAANNYNPAATIPCDGSNSNEATQNVPTGGGAQTLSINTGGNAATDNDFGTCCQYTPGCTHQGYVEHNVAYVQDDGNTGALSSFCQTPILDGCMNPIMGTSYNPNATQDPNDECVYVGCVDNGDNNGPTPQNQDSLWDDYICNDTTMFTNANHDVVLDANTTITAGTPTPKWQWAGCQGQSVSAQFNTNYAEFTDVSTGTTTEIFNSTTGVNLYDPMDFLTPYGTIEKGSCINPTGGTTGCTQQFYTTNDGLGNIDPAVLVGGFNPLDLTDGDCEFVACDNPLASNYFCVDNPQFCDMTLGPTSPTTGTPAGLIDPLIGTLNANATPAYACANIAYPTYDCDPDGGPNPTGGASITPIIGCVENPNGTGEFTGAGAFQDCMSVCRECSQVTAKRCNGTGTATFNCDGIGGSDGLEIDGFGGDFTGAPGQVWINTITAPYFVGQRFRIKEKIQPMERINEQSALIPAPAPQMNWIWVSYEVETLVQKFSKKPARQAEGTQCFPTTWACRCLTQPCQPGDIGLGGNVITEVGGHRHYCIPKYDGTGYLQDLDECLENCPCEASGRSKSGFSQVSPKKVDGCPGHTGKGELPKSCMSSKYHFDKKRDVKEPVEPSKPIDKIDIDTVEPIDIDRSTEPTGSADVPERPTITPDTPELKESKKLRKLIKKWKRNNL